jgi:hypothetical protein
MRARADLERKIEILRKERSLLAWESRLRKGWVTDEEFTEAVERLYRRRLKGLGLDPDGDPPLYSIPKNFGDPDTGILVGHPVHEEVEMPPLYLPMADLTLCHVGVWGRTRYGKTYLLARLLKEVSRREPGRSFLCYDTQGEFPGILANLLPQEKLLWVPIEEYWKNPLQSLYDHGLDKATGIFKRGLLESTYIGDATVNLLEQVIRRLCTKEKLSTLGPPPLGQILNALKNIDLSQGKSKAFSRKLLEYQHSLLNVLGNVSLNLGAVYNRPIRRGFSFGDFEGLVAVIDLSSIKDPIALKVFVSKELLELSLFSEKPHGPITVILDELHRFAPLQKGWGQFADPRCELLVRRAEPGDDGKPRRLCQHRDPFCLPHAECQGPMAGPLCDQRHGKRPGRGCWHP